MLSNVHLCYNQSGENMKKILITLLVALMLLSGCSNNEATLEQYTKRTLSAGFDTEVLLIGFAESESKFDEYFELTKQEYLRYNAYFDMFKSYEGINNIKTINDNAGIKPVVVDQEIIDLLLFIQEYDEFNDDKFDPTLGAVLDIWHNYREQGMIDNQDNLPGAVPSLETLQEADSLTGFDLLEIDDVNNTVYLTKVGASLDLGGVAKGWVTEKIAHTLEEAGLQHGALNAGGNVRTINSKPDGPWRIGVARPSTLNTSSVDTMTLDGSTSMVTSGDYQRFYVNENGDTYHHLIDPQTLMPSNYFRSITIITADSGVADLFSTILYLTNYEDGLQLLDDFNQKYPETPMGAIWVIDADAQAPSDDFFLIDDREFQLAVSENIQEYSRAISEKNQ